MRNTKTRKQKVIYVDILCYLKISIMIQWNSIVHCGGVIKLSLFLHILLSACLYDSVWVHLCPGSSHYPGAAHWSVVCLLQHQVLSCRHSRQSHHWEEEYMQEQREFYHTTTMYNTVPLYHNWYFKITKYININYFLLSCFCITHNTLISFLIIVPSYFFWFAS